LNMVAGIYQVVTVKLFRKRYMRNNSVEC